MRNGGNPNSFRSGFISGLFSGSLGRKSRRPLTATLLVALSLVALTMLLGGGQAYAAGVSLQQCHNGAASTLPGPDCDDATWASGSANKQQAHYAESYSVPYRAVMTGLPTDGSSITVEIGYDTKQGDHHGFDYLNHYQRLEPHLSTFAHPAETVYPTDGVSGVTGPTTTWAIPEPNSASPTVATASFNSLPVGERMMTLFGGTITGMQYVSEDDLTAANAETVISITFTADSETAVLAWGGHLAAKDDWGEGHSSATISGAPYHMRLGGSLGSQDRSISAQAVIQPPKLIVIKEVINDNGGLKGPGEFTINVTGDNPIPAEFAGVALIDGGTEVGLVAGAYTVTEDVGPGYAVEYSTECSGFIDNGEVKTCTITNDDKGPQLTVTKIVDNNNGGTAVPANFTMIVDATNPSTGSFPGDALGTTITLNAGAYSISESGLPGYTGSFSADCSGIIALGDDVTCTITNDDDAPSLTLNKILVKDNGGGASESDWTLTATATGLEEPGSISGPGAAGSADVVSDALFDAGTYDLMESAGPAGSPPQAGTAALESSPRLPWPWAMT